jgi:hypothetical protein
LGISASIEHKGHGVHGGDTDLWSFSNLPPLLLRQGLNGVEMEGTNPAAVMRKATDSNSSTGLLSQTGMLGGTMKSAAEAATFSVTD